MDAESQKLVKQAAFEFQLNPKNPGFQFHKLERCKDKSFSSARVNRDLRPGDWPGAEIGAWARGSD